MPTSNKKTISIFIHCTVTLQLVYYNRDMPFDVLLSHPIDWGIVNMINLVGKGGGWGVAICLCFVILSKNNHSVLDNF